VVCGGVETPWYDPVFRGDLEVDVLGLYHPGPEGVERQEYPVEMIGVIP